MTKEALQAIVRAELTDAASFIDSEVSPRRAKAADYYAARPFGDEVSGRSQVISQDVRDTVIAILPSLLRIFFGSEQVVEYVPRNDDDSDAAAQATDYIQYIVVEENAGFIAFHGWFKDALIRKTGIMKYWAETSRSVQSFEFSGIDDSQLLALLSEEGVEVVGEVATDHQADPPTHSVTIRKVSTEQKTRIANVPPEEFLISREAKNIESARFVAHRTDLTVSDLIAMGYGEDVIDGAGVGDSSLETNQERISRSPWLLNNVASDMNNPAMRKVAYTEAFIFVDFDGDGIAELRKVCMMGSGDKVVDNRAVDHRPFAMLCPDPEPHIAIGNSVADSVMDIQRIKSQVWRLILDSLAQTITPETTALEGQVNMADVLNNEIGKTVRIRQIGAYQHLDKPFNGQYGLPILGILDDMRESRTGITKASQGLNADVLQSTTKAAVSGTLDAAREHIEMIARIFGETGVKDLYKGLLRLVTAHQDREKTIRLRNKFVTVNPSTWDPMMDVSVDIGLGGGSREDKLATLQVVAGKQEAIIQTLGPENPIVTPAQYSRTLRKIVELSGFRDASQFFNQVPDDYKAPTPAPAEDPQAKTAMLLAQVEQQKTQAKIATDAADLDLKRQEMMLTDARERYRIETDARVKLADMQLKYHADVTGTLAGIEAQNLKIQADERAQFAAAQQPQEPVQ